MSLRYRSTDLRFATATFSFGRGFSCHSRQNKSVVTAAKTNKSELKVVLISLCWKWRQVDGVCPHKYPSLPLNVTTGVWTWIDDKCIRSPLDKGLCRASRTSPDFSLAKTRNHPLLLSAAITSSTIASAFSRIWSPVAS